MNNTMKNNSNHNLKDIYGHSLLSIMPLLRRLRRAPCTRKAYISEPKTSMKGIRGRSMIEMLGVLAIIGVLSAGGIMGYSAAMENYKVNKTIDMMINAATATPQFFVKRQAGNAYNTTNMTTTTLCRIGIIPSDICNAPVAGVAEYRKGYFGENLYVYVQQAGATFTGCSMTFIKSEGTGTAGICGPTSTRIAFGWYDTDPKLGKSACIKLMSSPAWKNHMIMTEPTNYQLPLSLTNAETICTNGLTNGTRIYIYTEGKWVNKS